MILGGLVPNTLTTDTRRLQLLTTLAPIELAECRKGFPVVDRDIEAGIAPGRPVLLTIVYFNAMAGAQFTEGNDGLSWNVDCDDHRFYVLCSLALSRHGAGLWDKRYQTRIRFNAIVATR